MSALDARLPVVVGVGQVVQRPGDIDEPDGIGQEPLALMADAAHAALADAESASASAWRAVDAIRVSHVLSWKYVNPARLLAERLGLDAVEFGYGYLGGQSTQQLVTATAADIAAGRLDTALVVGAEAWHSRMRARAAGIEPPWTPPATEPPTRLGEPLTMSSPTELSFGAVDPVSVYPLFESAARAAAGRTVAEQHASNAELWERFAAVAAANPYAWDRREHPADEIATPSAANRYVGFPYTRLMNAREKVDQASALLVCSAATARRLGIAPDRWVFVHAGVNSHEHPLVSERWSLAATPAIVAGGAAVLDAAGLGIDDVDIVDLYACFPSAVTLGAAALGLDLGRRLTETGGHSFAGGPWSNYTGHAIANVVTALRETGGHGLVWGNGGYLTKHAFGVYGSAPPAGGYHTTDPQPAIDALARRNVATGDDAVGPTTIEAYMVMHGRDGTPERALATTLLADGRRAWAASTDSDVTRALLDGEWVGRPATLTPVTPGSPPDNLHL